MDASQGHTATVIWLHGLGDTGHTWSAVASWLGMTWCRFVFPTAPAQPVSGGAGGYAMPSWFDYNSLDSPDVDEDLATLQRSVAHLLSLVEREERAGVPPERIVLAGFAQGGAVALAAALQSRRPLAGVLALSTWLPRQLPRPISPAAAGVPVLFCHGTEDRVVRFELGQDSLRRAEALGLEPQFKSYTGLGHEYGGQEMIDVQQFLLSRIASATTARGAKALPKGLTAAATASQPPAQSPGAKRPRLVVGGAPAHYNAPWLYGITSGAFAAVGVDVEWRDCHGGSSDMARLLAAGELDLAVLSTDGAVAELARASGAPAGAGFRIVSPFVMSPLTYGVYVPGPRGGGAAAGGGGGDTDLLRGLEGQPFAVSRRGSLSHVMTYLHATQVGRAETPPPFPAQMRPRPSAARPRRAAAPVFPPGELVIRQRADAGPLPRGVQGRRGAPRSALPASDPF